VKKIRRNNDIIPQRRRDAKNISLAKTRKREKIHTKNTKSTKEISLAKTRRRKEYFSRKNAKTRKKKFHTKNTKKYLAKARRRKRLLFPLDKGGQGDLSAAKEKN